ncbi:hypothetical protein JXA05_00720, partial [Candidatus Peregrinibacteria bacterium]|nr:hypothetical protein [Candidatus Peregrinibacteria bacterium]
MFFMNAARELSLKNPAYKKAVEFYVWGAHIEDAGRGDVTTKNFLLNPRQSVRAAVIAKESGILAGVQEAEWFLKKCGIRVIRKMRDGSLVRKGQTFLQ